MEQRRLDALRPSMALRLEVIASASCALVAIARGAHAKLTSGRWHLLVAGVSWLLLSALLAVVVYVLWEHIGSFPRLFLGGLARVLGVAAVIAAAIIAIVVAGDMGGGHGGGGAGGHSGGDSPLDVLNGFGPVGDPQKRQRGLRLGTRAELHAVLWPVGLALAGGMVLAFAAAALPFAESLTGDVVGLAALVVGVALGGATGFRIAIHRIARLQHSL